MKNIIETTPDGTPYEALKGRVTVTVSTEYMEKHHPKEKFRGIKSIETYTGSDAFEFHGPNSEMLNELLLRQMLVAYDYGFRRGQRSMLAGQEK